MTPRAVRRIAALAALCLLAAWSPGAAAHTYLILPFEDSAPDSSRDWLREAMALSLADYFLGAGQQVVEREERLSAMEELDLPLGAPLTLATSLRLGRHFRSRGAGPVPDRLVVGRFSLEDGQFSTTARILRLDANAAFSWKEESGSLKELLRLQKSLAQSLLRSDSVSSGGLAAHSDDANAGHAFPLVAYESYIRGTIDPSPAKQISYLWKALEQSPGYPKASFLLARLLARSGKKQEAGGVLKKVSGVPAPYGAEYHAFKGGLDLDAGRLSEAEQEARQSLSVKETGPGYVLMARIARAQADPTKALQQLERAEALDPDNPDIEPLRLQISRETSPSSSS